MKKLVLIPLILLAGLSAGAKNLSEQDTVKVAQDSFQVEQDKVHDIQQNLRLKGASYTWKKYFKGFGYKVMTFTFSDYYNLLTIKCEYIPTEITCPQSWGEGDIYTRTFSYEVENNEVVVAKYGHLVISDDAKYLTPFPFNGSLSLRLERV